MNSSFVGTKLTVVNTKDVHIVTYCEVFLEERSDQ